MWPAVIGAVAGIAGALINKKAGDKAAAAYAEAARIEDKRLRELAAPWQRAAEYALPAMQGVANTMAPNIGKESAIMRGQHKLNLTEIERGKKRGLASSKLFWKASGNQGKARGEALNISRMATETANRENLGYGAGQEDYKTTNRMNFLNVLKNMTGAGEYGTQVAVQGAQAAGQGATNAAQARYAGATGWAEDITTAGGGLFGTVTRQQENERLARILGTGTPGAVTQNAPLGPSAGGSVGLGVPQGGLFLKKPKFAYAGYGG